MVEGSLIDQQNNLWTKEETRHKFLPQTNSNQWFVSDFLPSITVELENVCSVFSSLCFSFYPKLHHARPRLRAIYMERLSPMRQAYAMTKTWIASCKLIYYVITTDMHVCKWSFHPVVIRPVISLLHARKSYRLNRPLRDFLLIPTPLLGFQFVFTKFWWHCPFKPLFFRNETTKR